MLKVLIIDDEPIVREGIKTIIDWESYGFSICGDAANGMEGLKKFKELQPDLIIVDIKMPLMDGLQMIEELLKEKIEAKIIILTGYSYFEYAKKALKLGIKSYLLKPIEENELIEEITKIYDEVIGERKVKDYMNKSVILSKGKVLENIVYGNDDSDTIKEFNDFYSFNFPWDTYQVVLLMHKENAINKKEILRLARDIARTHIEENNLGFVFEVERYLGILLKNVDAKEHMKVLADLLENMEASVGGSSIMTIGTKVYNFDDIPSSFQYALELMDRKFFFKDSHIIDEELVRKYTNTRSESYIGNIVSSLLTSVETHNEKKIINDISEVRIKLLDYDISRETIKAYYLSTYITIVNNLGMKYENAEDIMSEQKLVYKNVHSMTSLDEVEDYIKEQLLNLSKTLLEKKSVNVINNVLAYIHKNLEKDIKLDTLAKVFNYNSAYLGKMFKDQTGEYFNTYLDKVRMEKAKQLLKEGHKVYTVAENIGYSNINYFYSKFKKYIGQSPSSIRES